MYWQDVDPDTGEPVDILHVVGRTFHAPNKYFYRQLLNGTTWTPWQPVQVDINGDHLLAVIWERRLRLIWPVFTSATVTGRLPQRRGTAADPAAPTGRSRWPGASTARGPGCRSR